MQLLFEKIIVLILFFFLGFGAGVCPYLLKNRCLSPSRCRDKLVSFLNCFSAGVFFATFFLHMMPESQEEFSAVFGDEIGYPFAELLISGGFFFVMLVEQIVMECFEKKKPKTTICTSKICDGATSCDPICKEDSSFASSSMESKNLLDVCDCAPLNLAPSETTSSNESTTESDINKHCHNGTDGFLNHNVLTENKKQLEIVTVVQTQSSPDDSSSDYLFHPQFNVKPVVFLFALSTHALLEGLAIGFQNSASALRSLMFAVVIHKMALAFSFGISLVNNHASLVRVLLSMLVFSAMAPVGIGIGTALNMMKSHNVVVEMVVAVLQAFAAGTFVYIIFMEIIPGEFLTAKKERGLSKLTFLAVGFSLMAGLQALPHGEE